MPTENKPTLSSTVGTALPSSVPSPTIAYLRYTWIFVKGDSGNLKVIFDKKDPSFRDARKSLDGHSFVCPRPGMETKKKRQRLPSWLEATLWLVIGSPR